MTATVGYTVLYLPASCLTSSTVTVGAGVPPAIAPRPIYKRVGVVKNIDLFKTTLGAY